MWENPPTETPTINILCILLSAFTKWRRVQFWGDGNKTDLNLILKLQKAGLRIVLKQKPNSYVTAYFKQLEVTPIYMVSEYAVLKF